MTRSSFTLIALAALWVGCAPKVVLPPPYSPSFAYEPPTGTAGQGVSIALINPRNTERVVHLIGGKPEAPMYTATRDAVGRSLLQYLTANGITVSGPYKSVDEMTYPEKKQADLVISVEYDIWPQWQTAGINKYGRAIINEPCSMTGGITFVMWEPLSMQRMWSKSAEVNVSGDCNMDPVTPEESNRLFENAMAKLYESAFRISMESAARYFNPEEVALVKTQAQELREKKVY